MEQEDGTLKFAWPSRFQPNPAPGDHTVKEACWKVLADMAKTEDDVSYLSRVSLSTTCYKPVVS